jgi:hypothetical protein
MVCGHGMTVSSLMALLVVCGREMSQSGAQQCPLSLAMTHHSLGLWHYLWFVSMAHSIPVLPDSNGKKANNVLVLITYLNPL